MGLRSDATYLKRTYTPDNSKKNYMHFLYFGLVNAYPVFEDKTIKLVVENPEKLLHHNLLQALSEQYEGHRYDILKVIDKKVIDSGGNLTSCVEPLAKFFNSYPAKGYSLKSDAKLTKMIMPSQLFKVMQALPALTPEQTTAVLQKDHNLVE